MNPHASITAATYTDLSQAAQARVATLDRYRKGLADFRDVIDATVAENKIRVRHNLPTVTSAGKNH